MGISTSAVVSWAATNPGTIAAVSGAVAAAGTVTNVVQTRSAQATQRKQFKQSSELTAEANKQQQQVADLANMRAQRAAAREAQVRGADILSAGIVSEAGGSSSVQGAMGSVATQGTTNQSFLDTTARLQSQASTLFGEASRISSTPIQIDPTAAAAASIGGTVFGASLPLWAKNRQADPTEIVIP